MPYRLLAASEIAEFLRALAHPRRVQILEELRRGERDVASLAKRLVDLIAVANGNPNA